MTVAPELRRSHAPSALNGSRPHRNRPRPRLRLLARLVVLAVGLAAVGAGALWELTPSVAGAMSLTRQRDARFGAAFPGPADPPMVVAALTATEDSRFFADHGVDLRGLVRGSLGVVLHRPAAGGATLNQQLAKLLYTGGQSGPRQIVEQLALAVKLDAAYSKEQILRMYLSTVYFGDGATGLAQASQRYFARTPAQLDWAQASMLAGLVQAPSAYDPVHHLTLARQRQRHVLDRLVATGHLTAEQANRVYDEPLGLQG